MADCELQCQAEIDKQRLTAGTFRVAMQKAIQKINGHQKEYVIQHAGGDAENVDAQGAG